MKTVFLFAKVLILIFAIIVSVTACTSPNRITDLMTSSKEGDIVAVKNHIAKGAAVNAKNEIGKTALMFASDIGHIKIVKELIKNGADIQAKDFIGTTALIAASAEGHLEVVKELIINGADINVKTAGDGIFIMVSGHTALLFASQNDHNEIVKELITNGADVNSSNWYGTTALMYSASNGDVQSVKELITNGADVNAKDNGGYTALIFSSREGHTEVVKELIANGAVVKARTTEGETSLSMARAGKYLEIIELLQKAGVKVGGIKVTATDNHIDTAFYSITVPPNRGWHHIKDEYNMDQSSWEKTVPPNIYKMWFLINSVLDRRTESWTAEQMADEYRYIEQENMIKLGEMGGLYELQEVTMGEEYIGEKRFFTMNYKTAKHGIKQRSSLYLYFPKEQDITRFFVALYTETESISESFKNEFLEALGSLEMAK